MRAPLSELRNGAEAVRRAGCEQHECAKLRELSAFIVRAPSASALCGAERTLAALALHAWRRGVEPHAPRAAAEAPQLKEAALAADVPAAPPAASESEGADADDGDVTRGVAHARRAALHRALSVWRRYAARCSALDAATASYAALSRRRLLRAAFAAMRGAAARARRAALALAHVRRRRAAHALLTWRCRCEWVRWEARALAAAARHRAVALLAAAWVTWHEAARAAARRFATAERVATQRCRRRLAATFRAWRAQGAAAEARAVPAAWRAKRLRRCALAALRSEAATAAAAAAAATATHRRRRAASCLRSWAGVAAARREERNVVALFRHKRAARSSRVAFALWAAAAALWAAASRRRGAAVAMAVGCRARRALMTWRDAAAAPRLAVRAMHARRTSALLDAWRDAAARGLCARLRAAAADRLWARRAGGKALIGWAVAAVAGVAAKKADATAEAFAMRSRRRRCIAQWRAGVAAAVRARALTELAVQHATRAHALRALRGWRAALLARRAADAALQAALRRFASANATAAASGDVAERQMPYLPARRERPQPRRPAWLSCDS